MQILALACHQIQKASAALAKQHLEEEVKAEATTIDVIVPCRADWTVLLIPFYLDRQGCPSAFQIIHASLGKVQGKHHSVQFLSRRPRRVCTCAHILNCRSTFAMVVSKAGFPMRTILSNQIVVIALI